MRTAETYTPAEISAVTGASVRAIYKTMGERLPRGLSVQRDRQHSLTRWGAVCFVIDRELPKDVPVAVRRQLYATILERQSSLERESSARVQFDRGILSYVTDVEAVADRVDADLARYRDAMTLIVEEFQSVDVTAGLDPAASRSWKGFAHEPEVPNGRPGSRGRSPAMKKQRAKCEWPGAARRLS